MISTIVDAVFNGLLIGTTTCAMIVVNPIEHPFAFTASVVGFCHGCTTFYGRYFDNSCEDEEGKCTSFPKDITTTCMEIVTVPLANIDFYRCSDQTSALALGHSFFIIPLIIDLQFKVFQKDDEQSTEILADLTALGNIVSLSFFSVNEGNIPAMFMALSAFFAYFGSKQLEKYFEGTQDNATLGGFALFFGLLPLAIDNAHEVVT